MMKKTSVLLAALCVLGALTGCEKETKETTSNFILPKELSDCRIFKLTSDNGSIFTVVRCPLSNTSTLASSKGATPNAVIETTTSPKVVYKENGEVEIDGELYRKYNPEEEVKINGETYKKIPK